MLIRERGKEGEIAMDKQEELTSKPHIMAISFPLQGHMNPVVQFSKRLVSRGIRLTIVTTTTINMHTQLANSINIEHISTDPSEGETPNTIDDYIALFKLSVSKSLPDIITKQKTNGHSIKVLVYDSLMPWALDIAHKFGIQGVSFFTQSCAICAIFYNIHRGTLRIPYDEGSNYVSLPSMPLLEIKDLPSFVYDIGPYQGLLSLSVDQFSNMKKANCVLFNTFDELESEFSKRLASKGLRVTLIATTNTIKPMEESQALNNIINIEYISYEHGQKPQSVDEYIEHIKRKVSENLPTILDKQNKNGYPVNVLVHDSLMPWAIDLGHGLGLKVAQYFTQACTVCAIFYHVYHGKIKAPLKECSDLISLPSLPELEIRELPSDLYVDLYPGTSAFLASLFSHLHKADRIFFNSQRLC